MGFMSRIRSIGDKARGVERCARPSDFYNSWNFCDIICMYGDSGDINTSSDRTFLKVKEDYIISISGKSGTTYFDSPTVQRWKNVAWEREVTFIALKNVILRSNHDSVQVPVVRKGHYEGSDRSLSRVWVPETVNYKTVIVDGLCAECGSPFELFCVHLEGPIDGDKIQYLLPGFTHAELSDRHLTGFTRVTLRCQRGSNSRFGICQNPCYNSLSIEHLGITQADIDAERLAVKPTVKTDITQSTYRIW